MFLKWSPRQADVQTQTPVPTVNQSEVARLRARVVELETEVAKLTVLSVDLGDKLEVATSSKVWPMNEPAAGC